ncbi:uncharacterized protein LOC143255114 isoform X2 [Tachypleus tridentatus]|uniref:uncharacterized protein LOC143255114 isoform X2 n=1 Tax=Tachypleus tridentatus TaxID=6853 RepID=UPI003FCF9B52
MADEEVSSDFSDPDPDEITRSLAGLDDLDDNLFGSSLKTPKADGLKVNPSRAEKKQTPRRTSIGFDDDDPLAGLLSDDEDIPQEASSSKRKTSLKTKDMDLEGDNQKKEKGLSHEASISLPKKEEKIEESQPKKNNSLPQQSGRRGVRKQPKNNIGFEADDLDILGGMGLSEETGKQKADKPKNRSFLDDLLGKETERKEKSRMKEFVLDDKYKTNKSEENNEFHFGGYNPSSASEQQSGSGLRRLVRFSEELGLDSEDKPEADLLSPKQRRSIRRKQDPLLPSDQGRHKGDLGAGRNRSSGLDWLEGSDSDIGYKPTLERARSRDSVPTFEKETMSNKASVGRRGELDWLSGSDSEYKSNVTSSSHKLTGANETMGESKSVTPMSENRSASDKLVSDKRRGSGFDWLGGFSNERENMVSGSLGGSGRRRDRQQSQTPQPDLLGFDGEINSQGNFIVSKTEKTSFVQKNDPVDLIEKPRFFQGEPTNKNLGGIKQDESSGIDKNQTENGESDDWLLLKKKFEANKSPVSPKLVPKTATPSKSQASVELSPANRGVEKSLNQEISDHKKEDVAVGVSPFVSTYHAGVISTPIVMNTTPNPIVQANHIELEGLQKSLHLERDQLLQSMEAMRTRYQEEINHLQTFYQNQQKSTEEIYQQKETRIKEDYEKRIRELQTSVSELEREKSELIISQKQKLENLEQDRKEEVERLKNIHSSTVASLKKDHEEALSRLQRLKNQEIEAITSTQDYNRSLQALMDQLQARTLELSSLHAKVDSKHQQTLEEREELLQRKDKELQALELRLQHQQEEAEQERGRLQVLILRLESRLQQQTKEGEEERWKLQQERVRLEVHQRALEDERKLIEEEIERERKQLNISKDALLHEQKEVFSHLAREREKVMKEKTEWEFIQQHRQEQSSQSSMKNVQEEAELQAKKQSLESSRHRLQVEQERLQQVAQKIRIEEETLEREKYHIELEKNRLHELGLQVKRQSEEIEEMCMVVSP